MGAHDAMPRRGSARGSAARAIDDRRHAVPAAAARARARARSRSSSALAVPESMTSTAYATPSRSDPARPATTSAAPVFRTTTSRRGPCSRPSRMASIVAAFVGGVAAAELLGRRLREPVVGRGHLDPGDAFGRHVEDDAAVVERQLVDAVTGHDERALGAERLERRGRPAGGGLVGDAHELPAGPRRVGDRSDEVECGPHPELHAHRASMAHPRMERRRMKVGVAIDAERGLGVVGSLLDRQPERRHDVRAAGHARDRAVASLGDRHAGGGRDDRRRRRDVEGRMDVAAGPADVDRAVGGGHGHGAGAHRPHETGQLLGLLAAHSKAHQQGRELGWRDLAVEDRGHEELRGRGVQRLAGRDLREAAADGVGHLLSSPRGRSHPTRRDRSIWSPRRERQGARPEARRRTAIAPRGRLLLSCRDDRADPRDAAIRVTPDGRRPRLSASRSPTSGARWAPRGT